MKPGLTNVSNAARIFASPVVKITQSGILVDITTGGTSPQMGDQDVSVTPLKSTNGRGDRNSNNERNIKQ
jgi:hypothetical protein